jgi:hypothetical protein
MKKNAEEKLLQQSFSFFKFKEINNVYEIFDKFPLVNVKINTDDINNLQKSFLYSYNFYEFIKLNDYFNKTNHFIIIKSLYFSEEEYSRQNICLNLFIDNKTLYRYRIKYIDLLKKIICDLELDIEKCIISLNKVY